MNAPHANHPSPADLAAFAVGKLSDADAAAVASHLDGCPDCRRAAESAPDVSFLSRVKDARHAPPPGGTPLPGPAAPVPGLPPELGRHPRYRVLRELRRGGMGVVYQARQTAMDRQVVIKVISRALLDHPDALARFRREVRAAANLAHPNIVIAHDAEQVGDLQMLVMEFVPGQSLAEVLQKRGPLPVREACEYVRQAALGLQHAFEQGMVHRDVKPHNLMLTPKGQVKVLDFGLAKVASERAPGKGLTAANVYMGTPDYCAPEQALDARSADTRADVYSLGCTLYCLLAGRPPFQEDTAVKTILAHAEKEPTPLPDLRPDVPSELWAVLARVLAKDPRDRYQTPGDVAQALAPYCEPCKEKTVPALPPDLASPGRATVGPIDTSRPPAPAPVGQGGAAWRSLRLVAGLAGAAAVLGVGLWLLAAVLRVKTSIGIVELDINEPGAEVSVDGKQIDVRVPGEKEPVRIEVEEGRRELKVTRDGFESFTREVVLKAGKVERLKVTLKPLPPPEAPAAAPMPAEGFVSLFNGKGTSGWRTYQGGTGGWRVEGGALLAGGPGSFLYSDRGDLENFDLRAEVLVGDGSHGCLCFRCPFTPLSYYALLNVNGPEPQRTGSLYNLAPRFEAPHQPDEWFPLEIIARGEHVVVKVKGQLTADIRDHRFITGHIALVQDSPGPALRFRRIEVRELPRPAPPERLALADAGTLTQVAKSAQRCVYDPTGRRLVTTDETSRVSTWDVTRRRLLHSFDARVGAIWAVAYAPDGKGLAVAGAGAPKPVVVLYDDDAGHGRREIASCTARITALSFRRDGRALVISSDDGTVAVYPIPPGGAAVTRNLGVSAWHAAFSPDGRHVAAGGGGNIGTVWLLDPATLQDQAVFRAHGAGMSNLVFSPDGGRLATSCIDGKVKTHDVATRRELMQVPVSSAAPVAWASFSPDGKWLATADSGGEVWLWDSTTGWPLAQRAHGGPAECVVFRPDGKQLAILGRDGNARLWDVVPAAEPGRTADGFTVLFNGTDLTGWRTYGGSSAGWKVEAGELVSRGRASPLFSERGDYEDFHLRLDAQVSDGGRLDVNFRSQLATPSEGPQTYAAPLNATARFPQRTGSVADLAPVTAATHRAGEWFVLEIIAQGDHFVTKVNGTREADLRDRRFRKGYLTLRPIEPATVARFRRIEVKPLPPEVPAAGR
jgi:tRNA A-37 threonylcarbamoyl transferase component Bud32